VARQITIRRSLVLNLGLMILGLCLAILAITVYTGNQIVATASGRMIDRALDRADAELRGFFDPVERNLLMARGWLEAGTLDPQDDARLNAFFLPLLQAYPQISSINLGDPDGRGFMLLRRPAGWLNRRVDPIAFGDRVFYREWDASGGAAREWWVDDPTPEERYDPRTRDWYETAVAGAAALEPGAGRPEQVYWTSPYVFFTTGAPGLTGSVHVHSPAGSLLLAFDVLLSDISAFTQRIEISPNGFVGILSEDRQLVGLPRHPKLTSDAQRSAALLKQPRELGIEVFDDAIGVRQTLGLRVLPEPGEASLFAFESGGERYWTDVRAFAVPPDHRYLVVVTVPERDLLGPIRRLRGGVLGAAGLALLASIGSAFGLARRYSRPLSDLARNSTRIRHLDLRKSTSVESGITEIAQLAGAQEGMRAALDAFSRYVPTDVVRELVEIGEAAKIGGERKTLTVLFSDIEGFTRIAEGKSPEELTHHLATYFDEMLPIIDEVGTVDKLVGDGIMAFWGAPYPDPRHATHAVEAVLACQKRLAELNARWLAEGEPPLPTRFGLASGPALVGNVGSERRLSYTAVGDAVNLASRLEGLNRAYGTSVMAADPVPQLAGERFAWRALDRVRVVGRSQAVEVHELLGLRGEVDPERLVFARRYERALALYRAGSFREACDVLAELSAPWREDVSVERLRTACTRWIDEPPPDGWEPITLLDQK
jgi:adenylate cyclase